MKILENYDVPKTKEPIKLKRTNSNVSLHEILIEGLGDDKYLKTFKNLRIHVYEVFEEIDVRNKPKNVV